jgi:hypothetical protein
VNQILWFQSRSLGYLDFSANSHSLGCESGLLIIW